MKRILATFLLAISLTVVANALSSAVLSSDPAPLQPGDYADITIRLEAQQGEDLEDVSLAPLRTDLIQPISDAKQYPSIQEGDTITATFTVYIDEETPQGNIPFLFKASATNSNQTFDKRIQVADELDDPELRVGATKTTPNEVLQDTEDNQLDVTLNNLGDQAAKQVTAALQPTQAFTESHAYSFKDTASSIQGNGEHTFTYTFDIADGQQEPISTEISLEYREDNEQGPDRIAEETIPLTVPVSNAPHLEVTDVNVSPLKQGSVDNPVRVTVLNNGTADADEVRVRLFPDISYPFIFDTTTRYVASTLKPGDTATVEYDAEVLQDANPRDYQITTELESLVNTNRYERQTTITVPVSEATRQEYGFLPYAIVSAIIIVAALVGYYQHTRRS